YFAFAGAHGPGNAKARRVHRDAFGVNKIFENLRDSAVVLRLVKTLYHTLQLAALILIRGQKHAGGANDACQDRSITLHPRPPRCNKSSDSFGPQVPAL